MPLSVYRVCRSAYSRLDGEGAKLVGGRWNSPGKPVVYTSHSISLAVLENLVHMAREDYPSGYVVVQAIIPDSVHVTHLEANYHEGSLAETTAAGDLWLSSNQSAVMEVPSFVVRGELNFLLNPLHPDFRQIVVSVPKPFTFDMRLFDSFSDDSAAN